MTGPQIPDESHPPVEGEIAPISLTKPADESTKAVQRSRTRRVVAAAAGARDRTIDQLVALLVVAIAAVPAVAVILVALLRPGPDDPFWVLLGVIGLVVAGWLGLRRRQLLAVAQDPEALAAALALVVNGRDMWDQLVSNVSVTKVGTAVVRKRSRPLRILGGMWRGVQLTGVVTEILGRPQLAPLMPGRLRGIWFLGIACLITGAVLSGAVVIAGLLYLLGA